MATGQGTRGAVVGCYLPALVANEGQMRSGRVRLKLLMKKVAVGRAAPGFEQTVGIRYKHEWHEYKMSREQLVGITG